MKRFSLFRWDVALSLAIALLPCTASAQEDGTVTISGTFSMDYVTGELDLQIFEPDLLTVYNNGHEHTWTLTLHGTTQSNYYTDIDYVEADQDTEIHATSFDLEFSGPDAATLNSIVSEHIAGNNIWVLLRNHYSYYTDDDYAEMHVVVGINGELYFSTGQYNSSTLFPIDPDGYPVVGPEPFSIEPRYTELGLSDLLSGTGGAIGSLAGLVTFELVTAILPGDYSQNGIVDAADYTAWRDSLGGDALINRGAGISGTIGDADYQVWKANFGQSLGAASAAVPAVPEPSVPIVLAMGILCLAVCRRC